MSALLRASLYGCAAAVPVVSVALVAALLAAGVPTVLPVLAAAAGTLGSVGVANEARRLSANLRAADALAAATDGSALC